MTLLAMKHTVQLLHDARGIYGVGLVDRAVENDRCPPEDLILRPDRLLQAQTPGAAALQMIIGGFRHGMFSHMAEEHLCQHIHWEMLRRRASIGRPSSLNGGPKIRNSGPAIGKSTMVFGWPPWLS